MKKLLPNLILIVSIFFVTSCKKSNDTVPNYDYINSYLPLKSGNEWTYLHNDKDTVIAKVGDSFSQGLQTFNKVGDMYYSQVNDKYYMMIYPGGGIGFSVPILDASQFKGYSITTKDSTAFSSDPTPVLSMMTIVDNNSIKTVNGQTYKNVIHTVVDVYQAFNGEYMNIQTYDFYFSFGIGLIEIDKSNADVVYDTLTIVNYKLT